MAVVASALLQAGHQVRQYDCLAQGTALQPLVAQIKEFDPDLLSISLRNIDDVNSFSGESAWYLRQIKDFIADLRQQLEIPIVVGGPALTIMPEAIAEYLAVDHAIVGEGELALPQLVADLAAGVYVEQVIERKQPLTGNQFSTPLFEPRLVDFYLQQSGMVNLQTKRGCPYLCTYCSYPQLEGRYFRMRSPQVVVDELLRLKQEHGVERVFFTDSVFNDPQGEYLKLIEEMLRRNLQIQWSAFFRPQGFARKELELMKRAGLYALELGTDAAADKTLAGIGKQLSFAEVFEVNRACIEEHLPAAHFVMFGGPDEDRESLQEGLTNMAELGESVVFAFSGIRIHPGTALQQRAIEEGVIAAETSLLKPVYYFSPKIEHEQMEAEIEKSFAGLKNRIFPPSEGLKRRTIMKNFGFNGLMWDRLIRFPKIKNQEVG